MISVIRAEQQRRDSLLTDEDPNFASDQWRFTDAPFVNELCLMLLVALRHQVERELVGLAARAADEGKEVSSQHYKEKVRQLRHKNSKTMWEKINDRLKLKSCNGYKPMEALRLLANSYKHDQSMEPFQGLLKLLNLEIGVNYAPLPESEALQEGLATFIGLEKHADYCDIIERFVEIASDFLVNVQSRTKLSKVKWGKVSLNPNDFAR